MPWGQWKLPVVILVFILAMMLPPGIDAAEAKPLAELAAKKHRGPQRIGDLLVPLLIRLGVSIEEEVESNTSEARSSD